jgi:acetyl-CoA acyltransferase
MSQVPMGASIGDGKYGLPFGPRMSQRYQDVGGLVPQGISAELIADKWGLTREDLDAFGAQSQQRAARARDEGRFDNQIIAVRSIHRDKETGNITESDELVTADEGIRPDTTAESLANLKPAFKPDGKVTAGNSSQITDGASAALIMSEDKAAELGLRPRARFHTFALAGADPIMMLTAPIPATQRVLDKAGLSLDDMDLVEINEAFASVVLAWQRETGADMSKVNVNGGAIALGHPLGCSGTKLLSTLLNELERTGGRYGLETMCEGGGMANATIIERLG